MTIGHDPGRKHAGPACVLCVLLSTTLLISGCATLSKEECLAADWQVIGFEDGARGESASRIGEHREACAKHGIAPALDAYDNGRNRGLRENFCRQPSAYQHGLRGRGYQGVCPADMERDFLLAYNYGAEIYGLKSQASSMEGQIERHGEEMEALEAELTAKEAELVRDAISSARRVQLLAEAKVIAEELNALDHDIETLQIELGGVLAAVDDLRADSPYE
ncbi:MAG: DUF2799 domain-containing protein [Gammaproteobacteria bacterium]